jgi:CrcB protein
MNFVGIIMVGVGGFFGSIARYVTVLSIDKKVNSIFPYGTLTVNLLGSVILGFITGMFYEQNPRPNVKLLLTTGFCGGFTTFSAFALENVNLFDQRFAGISILYTLLSIVAGFFAVLAGIWLGRTLS